jgi:hypothetical protein
VEVSADGQMKIVLYCLALATVLIGALGLYGECQYLTDDPNNQSRYQAMFFAAMPPIVLSPVLILFGVCYWWFRNRLSKADAILLNISTIPLLLSLTLLIGLSIFQ